MAFFPPMYFYAMPRILHKEVFGTAKLGAWKITEPSAFFSGYLHLTPNERTKLEGLPPVRQREWLASRYLLKSLIGMDEEMEIANHPTGKPYLLDRNEEISLSHSADCVAVMVGDTDVGVDIQICKEKILRLEHKFAHPEESACIDRSHALEHLHILWGAKETLYKIYARKQLHFITHLFVSLPKTLDTEGYFRGVIRISGEEIVCDLGYHILENYVLVYGRKNA